MPCFSPLYGYRAKKLTANGKRPIVFDKSLGFTDQQITLPCGRCRGCRLRRSEEWAIRCHCEASLYKENCFLTLTYDEKHLPDNGSINVRAFQLFMKKLRRENPKVQIRFFHCGEYGDKGGRPHYHAVLFNFDFGDKTESGNSNGHKLYSSKTLDRIWGNGMSNIGDVTFQSAAYVARYIMKKITGPESVEHYETIHSRTGEIIQRNKEYTTMSRGHGIGQKWLYKFHADVYPHDFIVIDGKKRLPPRYFDDLYEKLYPGIFAKVKQKRSIRTPEQILEQDSFRLLAKELIAEAQFKQLKRNLHDET